MFAYTYPCVELASARTVLDHSIDRIDKQFSIAQKASGGLGYV